MDRILVGRILVAIAAIGAALYLQAEAAEYPRAARRLPQLLGYGVMLLAALAIVQAVARGWRAQTRGAPGVTPGSDPHPDPGLHWRQIGIGVAFTSLIAVYAWAIPIAGYLIATPLMLFLPLAVLRPVGWPAVGVTVAAVTGTIWVIFLWFLNLPMPLYPGA